MNLRDIFQNSMFRGGAVFFICGLVANFLNYFYRIAMGRMLGPEVFGELIVIISLVLILATIVSPLQDTAVRYSAIYQAKGTLPSIKKIFLNFSLLSLIGGLIFLGIGAVFGNFFVDLLNLSSQSNFYFLLAIILAFLITAVGRGVLSGLCRFSQLGISQVADSLVRLVLGAGLVFLGFKLAGALGGLLIATLLSYGLVLYFFRDVIEKNDTEKTESLKIQKGEVLKYMGLSFLTLLFLNILLNIDVILVKHYFSEYQVGIYSGFATLGRGIFLIGQLLGGIIFPVAASYQEKGKDYIRPLKIILIVSFFLLFFACLVFFLFPKIIIQLFLGHEYLIGAPFLAYYGMIMGMLAILWNLSSFGRGLNRFQFLYFLVLGSILEIFLITIWHSSFSQILVILGTGTGVALLGTVFITYLSEKRACGSLPSAGFH